LAKENRRGEINEKIASKLIETKLLPETYYPREVREEFEERARVLGDDRGHWRPSDAKLETFSNDISARRRIFD